MKEPSAADNSCSYHKSNERNNQYLTCHRTCAKIRCHSPPDYPRPSLALVHDPPKVTSDPQQFPLDVSRLCPASYHSSVCVVYSPQATPAAPQLQLALDGWVEATAAVGAHRSQKREKIRIEEV